MEEVNEKKPNKVMDFLMKTLNGMAYGLFATLIVGTIFGAIGMLFGLNQTNTFCKFMMNVLGSGGNIKDVPNSGLCLILQTLTGAGIGVGIALALKFTPLQTVVLAGAGECAAFFSLSAKAFVENGVIENGKFQAGDPLTIFLVCIAVALAMKYVLRKKTPVDIVIIPLFGMTVAVIAALLFRFPSAYVIYGIQWLISAGTKAVPFIAGIVVAVLMGMALTAPISSAAIGAMVFGVLSTSQGIADNPYLAIASGAAIVGCCTQMIGFAVQTAYDNNAGMVASVGVGTSMLQFKNILKKPVIWLPTIIASAILGCLATTVPFFQVTCASANAGMGTAGLVGIIGTIQSTGADNPNTWLTIIFLELVGPAVLTFAFDFLFRKLGWIKKGDLKI